MRALLPVLAVAALAFPAGAAPRQQKPIRISMTGAAFVPPETQAHPGQTIEWVNDDFVVHTVKAPDGSFSSRELLPGQSFRWKAKKGQHPYACTLHPNMKGRISVK